MVCGKSIECKSKSLDRERSIYGLVRTRDGKKERKGEGDGEIEIKGRRERERNREEGKEIDR